MTYIRVCVRVCGTRTHKLYTFIHVRIYIIYKRVFFPADDDVDGDDDDDGFFFLFSSSLHHTLQLRAPHAVAATAAPRPARTGPYSRTTAGAGLRWRWWWPRGLFRRNPSSGCETGHDVYTEIKARQVYVHGATEEANDGDIAQASDGERYEKESERV